jgi:tripartite-type tricarboxylate transporter receptor subunit TctC
MSRQIGTKNRVWATAFLAATLAVTPAMAEYPERVIQMIVPASPGGGSDTTARTIATYLQKHIGEKASIAIINRDGGGGAIGIAVAAAAKPDGYTIGQLQSPQVISKQFENSSVRFNADSFEYIGVVTTDSLAIAVLKDSKFRKHADLVVAGRSGPVNCAMSGAGGGPHLSTMMYMNKGGATLNLVNFKGGAEARTALLGGHVDAVCINIGALASVLDKLNVLVIASSKRNPLIPDTPTMGELGIDVEGGTQRVLGVPSGTPKKIVKILRDAYTATMADPTFLAAAQKASLQLEVVSGEAIDKILHSEEAEYRRIWAATPWIKDR